MFMRIFKLSAVTFDPKELKGRADKGLNWKQRNVGLRMAEQTSQESTVSWPELLPNICLQEPDSAARFINDERASWGPLQQIN